MKNVTNHSLLLAAFVAVLMLAPAAGWAGKKSSSRHQLWQAQSTKLLKRIPVRMGLQRVGQRSATAEGSSRQIIITRKVIHVNHGGVGKKIIMNVKQELPERPAPAPERETAPTAKPTQPSSATKPATASSATSTASSTTSAAKTTTTVARCMGQCDLCGRCANAQASIDRARAGMKSTVPPSRPLSRR